MKKQSSAPPANSIEGILSQIPKATLQELKKKIMQSIIYQKILNKDTTETREQVDNYLWRISVECKKKARLPVTVNMPIAEALNLKARWEVYSGKYNEPVDKISFDLGKGSLFIQVTVKPGIQEILKKLHSENSKYKNRWP